MDGVEMDGVDGEQHAGCMQDAVRYTLLSTVVCVCVCVYVCTCYCTCILFGCNPSVPGY